MKNERCEVCGKLIKKAPQWAEMDRTTGKLYRDGTVPEAVSQGCFPVGPDCARKLKSHPEYQEPIK